MTERIEVNLIGDGYTEEAALAMKAEMEAYALSKGLKGAILIIHPL